MANNEYNNFDEIQSTKEYLKFEAIESSINTKESHTPKNENLITEEYGSNRKIKKQISKKSNGGIIKKLVQRVSEAASSLAGGIAATATVAITSVIMFSSLLLQSPNIDLLKLEAGYDYVTYNLYIDEMSEGIDYYSIVSNNFESYEYELIEGENAHKINDLIHDMEYNLYVIGVDPSNNEKVEYFKTTFYTTKDVKNIKVKWIVEDVIIEEDEIEYGETPTFNGTLPTKESTNTNNYTFLEWKEEVDEEGNITYKALFESSVRLYQVKWIVEDVIIEEDEIEYRETPTFNGTLPTKESTNANNYTFLEWQEEVDEEGNITYTALFESSVRLYQVKWIVEDVIVEEDEIEYGETPTFNGTLPTKESTNANNYTFLEWKEEIDEEGNITYTALFESSVRLYQVKWIVEDVIVEEDEIEYGETPTFNGTLPTKESTNTNNYTFLEWQEEVDEEGNITYTALFESSVRLYQVKWIVEDVIVEEDEIEYGETPIFNGTLPTKESTNTNNYTFLEWSEEIDEEGNITYTALFESSIRLYQIKWVVEDVIVEEDEIEYGETPTFNGTLPTKESTNTNNYTFLEWSEEIDEEGNITYTALFESSIRLYQVKWIVEDVIIEEDEIEYGETPTFNGTLPTKESTNTNNYTFLEWQEEMDEEGNITYTALFESSIRLYQVKWIVEDVIVEEEKIEYGETPTFNGTLPTKEMTIEEEYEFIGWDKEIVAITEDVTYTALFNTIKHEYNATYNQLNSSDVIINYDNEDYYLMTFNTGFDNSLDSRLSYRIILTDTSTNATYIYEGIESISTIVVPKTVTSMSITYENIGTYNQQVKVFETIVMPDLLEISSINLEIKDELTLYAIDEYQLSMIINSDFASQEVYNSLTLNVTYDDSTKQEIIINDISVNEEMLVNIQVPAYCSSFTIDYAIDLLGANGHNPRTISGTKEFILESSFELINVYADVNEYMSARLEFKYHFTNQETTIAVMDTASSTLSTIYEGDNYIEVYLDNSLSEQELVYYLSDLDGVAISEETSVVINMSPVSGEFDFQYVNPGDAVVTFNEDDTMNIYLNTSFNTTDADIWYLVRYSDFNSGKIYDVKYTESIAYIEDIPYSNYGLTYYVYKTIEGIDYQLQTISVSGGVEVANDLISAEIIEDDRGNMNLYISYGDHQKVDPESIKILIDGIEYVISSSDFVLNEYTYELNYPLDYMPTELSVEYKGSFTQDSMYELILLGREIKGNLYKDMRLILL